MTPSERYEKETGRIPIVTSYSQYGKRHVSEYVEWLEKEAEAKAKAEQERDEYKEKSEANEKHLLEYDVQLTKARVILTKVGIPEKIDYPSGVPVCGVALPLNERIMMLIAQRDEAIRVAIAIANEAVTSITDNPIA